jgi:hypothetical protein
MSAILLHGAIITIKFAFAKANNVTYSFKNHKLYIVAIKKSHLLIAGGLARFFVG